MPRSTNVSRSGAPHSLHGGVERRLRRGDLVLLEVVVRLRNHVGMVTQRGPFLRHSPVDCHNSRVELGRGDDPWSGALCADASS